MTYPDLTLLQWLTFAGAAFMIGLSKAGLKGLGMVLVVLMASAFPAKASTGLVLPMLITGDIMAVI